MAKLRILCASGDEPVTWNPTDKRSTEAARAQFKSLMERSYALYQMPADKSQSGERVTTFDPQATEIIAVPPMAGG